MGAALGIAERLPDVADGEQARELMLPLVRRAGRVDQAPCPGTRTRAPALGHTDA
ncbi:hypothetical protein [Streptomyces enissocaesilis]|uniref:TetR family transcriptional regulator n=1 Tax=Streptomyces enissocaesilis TaxID=332589 RepID=A0ABP6K3S6_9ACTN